MHGISYRPTDLSLLKEFSKKSVLTCSLSSFQINDQGLEHMESLNYAAKLLNSCSILSLTLAKSCNTINSLMGGPLSSSSSGHNMHENETQNQNHQQNSSNQAQNHQNTGKNELRTHS